MQYRNQMSSVNVHMDDLQNQQVQKENPPDGQQCLNCGKDLRGRFCSHCGQDSRPFQRSLGSILSGAAEGLFDVDGKVLRSILPLLISPGKLTLDYLKGKRRTQVNPFQLYAFFSFLFFLTAFSSTNEVSLSSGSVSGAESDTSLFSVQVQRATREVFRENKIKGLIFEYDSIQNKMPEEQRDTGPVKYFRRKMRAFGDKLSMDEHIVFDLFSNMKSNVPNSMILLLPFFALILKLLYIRKPFFYIDHLVFSIHLFCFFFVLGMLNLFFEWIWPDALWPVFLLILPLYPVIAMKRIYGQSWLLTSLKFSFSIAGFSIIAIIALLLNFLVTVFFQL